MVSSRSTTSNGPGGTGGIRETSKRQGRSPSALARDVDGAGAEVHPQIGATQLPSDEPPRPGNSAAQVQHGDPGGNAGPTRQGPNLAGAHEALLLDELARGIRRHAGSLERLDERSALVLLHGCPRHTVDDLRLAASARRHVSRRVGEVLYGVERRSVHAGYDPS